MKKLILMISACAFSFTGIYAQDGDMREKLHLGLKAGMNYSNAYNIEGNGNNTESKAGFAGGFFLSVPIGKFLGIQPEMLVSQKGFKSSGNFPVTTYSHTRTSGYLDIPLFASLKPNKFLTLLAGPQLSYLFRQKDVFSIGSISYEQEKEIENSNIRKNTLCFVAGVDLNFNHIVIGARAGWDLQRNNGDGTYYNPNYKNVWYQATIGYRFNN
jgi:hypothetical protein